MVHYYWYFLRWKNISYNWTDFVFLQPNSKLSTQKNSSTTYLASTRGFLTSSFVFLFKLAKKHVVNDQCIAKATWTWPKQTWLWIVVNNFLFLVIRLVTIVMSTLPQQKLPTQEVPQQEVCTPTRDTQLWRAPMIDAQMKGSSEEVWFKMRLCCE